MEEAIEKIAVICFISLGLSHILQPRSWAKFFIYLSQNGETGAFINGFIHFPFGVLIVVFHNVWQGIPIVLTLIGYGLLIKGVINFVFPKLGLKSIRRVSIEKSRQFIPVGVLMIGIGLLLLYSLLNK